MTNLSVNINKIALLRNSRGRDYPNVLSFAKKFIALGVHGITVHPRQDERHVTMQDAVDLGNYFADLNQSHKQTQATPELNIEGYPSEDFLALVETIQPQQCTLVPDGPNQLTSDHGWNLLKEVSLLKTSIDRLKRKGIRTAIFLDPDLEQVELVPQTGADRIELYTESYAASFSGTEHNNVWRDFRAATTRAQALGIGVNAGHDLDLTNLPKFLEIKGILEVSIGHVLTVECIEHGMEKVVNRYLDICNKAE